MMKYLVCVVLFLVLDVTWSSESEELYSYELPCLAFGGICVQRDECPKDKLAQIKGLCPLQQKRGAECCHAIRISETRCGKRGGECFPNNYQCPEELIFREATDCADDEKCCYLV